MDGPIRVLVVDDSAFMRKVLTDLLNQDPELQVVGAARDGMDALDKVETLAPDVVTLDVEMPRLDGLSTLEELMKRRPLPVVMVSSLTRSGAEVTIRALAAGAVDFVAKPSGSISLDMSKVAGELVAKVKAARRARPRAAEPAAADTAGANRAAAGPAAAAPLDEVRAPAALRLRTQRVVVIGCSTGGPGALHQVLPRLPGGLAAGVLVVQHMPAGFTRSLADRLNELSSLRVREARPGDLVEPGVALVAPGGYHMLVAPDQTIRLSQDPPLHGVRPAVDKTLESVVPVFGCHTLAVIMTGMGYDGARGVAAVRRAGGRAIAEDESTCVVYGMPKVVVETGNADRVVPLPDMARTIADMVPALG
ncbi:MAG: protein-glutamate methylesterase/protein-glutamine glutaminase [Bacillota bacterium]